MAEKVLNTEISFKARNKDFTEIMDPLYNRDKIYERTITNVEIGHVENANINHQGQHVVELIREWIRKPFWMDPISQALPLQDITQTNKGKGTKITKPTYPTKSLVRPEMVHRHEREVEYSKTQKGKDKKRKEGPRRR